MLDPTRIDDHQFRSVEYGRLIGKEEDLVIFVFVEEETRPGNEPALERVEIETPLERVYEFWLCCHLEINIA